MDAAMRRGLARRDFCRLAESGGGCRNPPADSGKYTGPGSCSSTSCHGSVKPRADNRIFQNEYSIWVVKDKHAKAYDALTGAIGRAHGENPGPRKIRAGREMSGLPRARRSG